MGLFRPVRSVAVLLPVHQLTMLLGTATAVGTVRSSSASRYSHVRWRLRPTLARAGNLRLQPPSGLRIYRDNVAKREFMVCSISRSAVPWERPPRQQTERRGVSRPVRGLPGGRTHRPAIFGLFALLDTGRSNVRLSGSPLLPPHA